MPNPIQARQSKSKSSTTKHKKTSKTSKTRQSYQSGKDFSSDAGSKKQISAEEKAQTAYEEMKRQEEEQRLKN